LKKRNGGVVGGEKRLTRNLHGGKKGVEGRSKIGIDAEKRAKGNTHRPIKKSRERRKAEVEGDGRRRIAP